MQTRIVEHIASLAEAERLYGIRKSTNSEEFFPEWIDPLVSLSISEQERLNVIKRRYLYHVQNGRPIRDAVKLLVISPLLELAGFYDSPFLLQSETAVSFGFEDEARGTHQGHIEALAVKEDLWIVLVDSDTPSLSMTAVLPQALAYIASSSQKAPKFSLVSSGEDSLFLKLHQEEYAFSDNFSLNKERNELRDVLRILNWLKKIA